jgi:hypothetical protein
VARQDAGRHGVPLHTPDACGRAGGQAVMDDELCGLRTETS